MTNQDSQQLQEEDPLKRYYGKRAPVYDRVYAYPERQKNLRFLECYVARKLRGREVLEVAAGTGYWTQFIAPEAKSLTAIDTSDDALAQIKRRSGTADVQIHKMDAYQLDELNRKFDAGFAALWLSHVPIQKQAEFMTCFNARLKPGAQVILFDNSIRQCDRLPISYRDEQGNSYQDRELDDGSVHRVLKNFPTRTRLHTLIKAHAKESRHLELEHFWLLEYIKA